MNGTALPTAFPRRNKVRTQTGITGLGMGLFVAAHIPLALLLYRFSGIATVHAVVACVVGFYWACVGRKPERVAYAGAYIVGAEVLWRMTQMALFWEFGKYAMSAIFLISLLRRGCLRGYITPLLYFGLLLPSALLTFASADWERARRELSFNLSGPFALAMSAVFFSNLEISASQLRRILATLLGPVVGIASITLFATFTSTSLRFTTTSNFTTSGGFGPNQVSSILGFGAFLAFYYLLHDKTQPTQRALLIGCLVVFATQSAMTFSRGGLYTAAGAAVAASICLVRSARSRARLIYLVPLLFAIANYILLPRLEALTQGALRSRFEDRNLTGRDQLARADLRIWAENPVFGIGPGMAKPARSFWGAGGAAHAEFSRLLAEHGILGLLAIFTLLYVAARRFRRARTATERALVASLVAWSILYMLVNAMRMVTPSFAFGLAFVTVWPRKVRVAIPNRQTKIRLQRAPSYGYRPSPLANGRMRER